MRLSSNQIHQQGLNSILDTQERLVKAQDKITNQTKILTPSDDPAATAQVMRLNERIAQTNQYQTNASTLVNHLNVEEVAINSIKESVERAKSLAIQAGNGALSDSDRAAIALEITSIRDEVLGNVNTRNANGDYIFSGFQSQTQSFIYNAQTDEYDYQGDQGEMKLQVSSSVQLSIGDNGKKLFDDVEARLKAIGTNVAPAGDPVITTLNQGVFDDFHTANYDLLVPGNNDYTIIMDAVPSNNYTILKNNANMVPPVGGTFDRNRGVEFQGMLFTAEGTNLNNQVNIYFTLSPAGEKKNVLTTLNDLQQAISVPGGLNNDMREALQDASIQLNNASEQIAVTQSSIGGRINVAEAIIQSHSEMNIASKEIRADLAELDYAEGISELMREETALEAAQATFGRLSQLSLFDFIR